jgi:hypothetical protein
MLYRNSIGAAVLAAVFVTAIADAGARRNEISGLVRPVAENRRKGQAPPDLRYFNQSRK